MTQGPCREFALRSTATQDEKSVGGSERIRNQPEKPDGRQHRGHCLQRWRGAL